MRIDTIVTEISHGVLVKSEKSIGIINIAVTFLLLGKIAREFMVLDSEGSILHFSSLKL
jgi:hypothetical protein